MEKLYKEDIGAGKADYVSVRGPGLFHIYAVHQLEMLVMLMGTGATRIQQVGCEHAVQMVVVDDFDMDGLNMGGMRKHRLSAKDREYLKQKRNDTNKSR